MAQLYGNWNGKHKMWRGFEPNNKINKINK